MEVSKTLIKSLSKEDCVDMLTDINKELHNYNRTSPEQISKIIHLCAMVRERLDYLRLKESNNGRFLSQVTREKIDQASVEERKRLAIALADQQDFTSKCVIDYCNQLNYEQES